MFPYLSLIFIVILIFNSKCCNLLQTPIIKNMNILIEELRKKQEKERAAQRGQYRNQQPRPNPNMQRNPIQQQSYQNFNNINFNPQQRQNNQSYNQGYGYPGNRQPNYNYNEPNQGQFSNYTMPNNANQFRHTSNPNQSRGRGGFRGPFQPYSQQATRLQNRRSEPQDFIPPKNQQNQRGGYYNQNQQMQQGENNYKYRSPNYNQRYSQQPNNQRNYNFQSEPRNNSPSPSPVYNQSHQYPQSSGFSPQRGNNNFRGNNFRGRPPFNSSRGGSRENQFRGRGRFNRPNQDQIVDSRPMTQDQSQQRIRKFVNLNQEKYVSNQPRTQQQQRRGRGRGGRARGRGQQRASGNEYKKASRKLQQSQQQKSQTPIQSEQEFSGSEEQEQEQAGSSQMQVEGEEEYEDESNEEQADQQQSQRSEIFEEEDEQYSRSESAQKSSPRKGKGGEAEKMCSEKQFNNRMNIFLENNMSNIERTRDSGLKVINTNLNVDISKSFSIFQINKRTNLPDEQLAMKKFQRSANRADDQDDRENDAVYVPRNTKGLIITMNHIKKQILDCDSKKASQLAFPIPQGQRRIEFIQIYGVLWDRMREMIKDITRLDEESKHQKQIITICEEITRFFILSINQGRKKYGHALTFDDKMNKESLTKVMTPLLGLYADSKLKLKKLIKEMEEGEEEVTIEKVVEQMAKKGIYISPNQPQMTAYAILFSEDYRKYLYENIFIGFELSESNPLYESKQIQQVLNIKSALSSKNYSKYFDMLQSQDYDYLISNLMVLNVQGIRKQISQLLQHSLKYYDEGKTKKGVKEQYFKKMLHFGEDQDKQYKQFLRTIKAVVAKNTGYVNWDDSMPDDQKIYKIPPFPIDFKLERIYFQGQDAKGVMKRSEIVERSWKKSDYVEQLICCFLNQEYIPNISQIKQIAKKSQQKLVDKSLQQKQQKVDKTIITNENKNGASSGINRSNDLLAKKQELERRKFLDKLSSKMEQLIKPDKTKQQDRAKALKDMFNCLIMVQEQWKYVAFRNIQSCYHEQVFKEIYMLKLHQYITMKNHFIKAFNTTTPQLNPSPQTQSGISNLLLPQPTQPPSKHLKPELKLIQLIKNLKIKQLKIKIFIDIAKTDPNYILIDQVIKNIFCLLIPKESILQTTCNDCYQYVEDGHVVSVGVEGVDGRESWRKFLGADCVVFLQTKPEVKEFSIILTQFKHFQNCVKTSPFFNLPISVIRLIDSIKRNSFQTLNIKLNFECSQYLRPLTLQLSPVLSLGLAKVFEQSVACYRKRPNLQVRSFGQILSTISINMQYLCQVARQGCGSKQMFLYHQQYINMCVQQILRLSKTYYLSAGLFENWIELIRAVEGQQISTKLDNIEMLMQTQYRQLQNFAFVFVFISPMEESQNKIVFEKQDFVSHYFKLCRKFDHQGQVTEQAVQKYVDLLKINQGQITGQIYKFYQQILSLLSSLVANFNIVVPKQFRFYLNPENLHKQVGDKIIKIKQKCKRQQQKLARVQAYKSLSSLIFEPAVVNSMDISQKQEQKQKDQSKQKQSSRMLNKNKRQIRNQFKYEKAQWLADVKKKIKIV